ncbi:hypothetical protein GCM10009731_39470 [Streptomyces globosus]
MPNAGGRAALEPSQPPPGPLGAAGARAAVGGGSGAAVGLFRRGRNTTRTGLGVPYGPVP